ncbi:NAD(P)/FAD-dependent oxidoreductase [Hippea maritima]|uniref:Ferredoxin--NAD(+) reductase n=1 Tax=Hippea maritima (strain ATCC 700847 / DSM 10411 / MH2) TaxID=760142 RepID=F2LTR7_HIPMA|nr:FAD-dependent oxidoreductase [Hippea maritima]AEA34443.1 Ferredoxin--NAD(+) reductase [Hippea maritima DSM 10411]
MRVVIIGNSVAAVNAIEAVREKDKISTITVISDENYRPYSHPLLPNLVVGDVSRSEERFYYRRADFYEKNKVNTVLGKKVVRILPKNKQVELDNAQKVEYDKLLIACGGSPIKPPMEGLELEGVHTLTNIKAADSLKKDLKNIKKCVVIGGGLIGSKTAEKLAKKGLSVTLVELMRRVLYPVLDDTGADYIHRELKALGVRLILNDSVEEIFGDKRVKGVRLKSGKQIESDGVVVAVGVAPNTSLAREAGLDVDRGVVVNDFMQTSDENIFAAGDVAQAYDLVVGQKRPIPILPLAARQGRVAGLNMVGLDVKYKGGFPTNSITIGKVSFISMGIVDSDELEVLKIKKEGEYRKFLIDKDNRLKGAILVGNIEKAGMFNWMIQNRFDVSWIKDTFLNSDFGWKYFDKAFRVLRLDRKIK